jgi:hypothetical protein
MIAGIDVWKFIDRIADNEYIFYSLCTLGLVWSGMAIRDLCNGTVYVENKDTERLDWVLNHSPEWDHTWQTGEYWVIWFDGEDRNVMSGKSLRECIDKILEKTRIHS